MCWHSWTKWADREIQRELNTREAKAFLDGDIKTSGNLCITQERRCMKCNKLRLRQVIANKYG